MSNIASPTFRKATEDQATAILKGKGKDVVTWSLIPIDSFPTDIEEAIGDWIQAELTVKAHKARVQAMIDDKCEAPSGKRLIVTLGRDVSASTSAILYAWADAAKGGARMSSFDALVKGK